MVVNSGDVIEAGPSVSIVRAIIAIYVIIIPIGGWREIKQLLDLYIEGERERERVGKRYNIYQFWRWDFVLKKLFPYLGRLGSVERIHAEGVVRVMVWVWKLGLLHLVGILLAFIARSSSRVIIWVIYGVIMMIRATG